MSLHEPRQSEPELPERGERKRFGANVSIRNLWIRHAEKQSGDIANTERTGLAQSAISERGVAESHAYGERLTASQHGLKGYVSPSVRTRETLEAIAHGYEATNARDENGSVPIRATRVREELIQPFPSEFLAAYDDLFQIAKAQLLTQRGLSPRDFSSLLPAEQALIAEAAEEPVIRQWLDHPDGSLAALYPPRQAASWFAGLFARHHGPMARKLKSDSAIDLVHVTHKTATEPFLVSGVLLRADDGVRITRLEQLGGSLGLLDSWESDARTNEAGEAHVTVRLRGNEYTVDEAMLRTLVQSSKREENV